MRERLKEDISGVVELCVNERNSMSVVADSDSLTTLGCPGVDIAVSIPGIPSLRA